MIPVKYSFILKHNIKEIAKLKSQGNLNEEESKKTKSHLQLPTVESAKHTLCKSFQFYI